MVYLNELVIWFPFNSLKIKQRGITIKLYYKKKDIRCSCYNCRGFSCRIINAIQLYGFISTTN